MSISVCSVHRGRCGWELASRVFSRVGREIEGKSPFGTNSGSMSRAIGSLWESDAGIADKDSGRSKNRLDTNDTPSSAFSIDSGTSEGGVGYGRRGLESSPLGSNDSDMAALFSSRGACRP